MIKNNKPTSIRKCLSCNQDIEMEIGLNKVNLHKLFRKPTLQEAIVLFVLIVAVASFLSYRIEINAYKTYMNENCTCTNQYNNQNTNQLKIINFSEIQYDKNRFKNENEREREM